MSSKLSGKVGRPEANQSRVEGSKTRPERPHAGDFRNILNVKGLDPEYEYRWVKDDRNDGQKIYGYQENGWELVSAESGVKVGERQVFTSENTGSVVRIPAGQGEYLYLMRIYKDWFQDDKRKSQAEIDEMEKGLERSSKEEGPDGLYGDVRFSRD